MPSATPSITPSPTTTATRVPAVVESSRPDGGRAAPEEGGGLPLWGLGLGLLATLLVGGYVILYSWNSGTLDRYAGGFVLTDCPICGQGHLILEERPYSVLGIPRVRRTVRCDNCRSVLREVGRRQWRYAVDPAASRGLYEMLNNKVLPEQRLAELRPKYGEEMPAYVEDEPEL